MFLSKNICDEKKGILKHFTNLYTTLEIHLLFLCNLIAMSVDTFAFLVVEVFVLRPSALNVDQCFLLNVCS